MGETQEHDRRPILTRLIFAWRLAEEVARIGRTGGFLSLLLVQGRLKDNTPAPQANLRGIADRLRSTLRVHDVLGHLETFVSVLLTETPSQQGLAAARRLLHKGEGEDWQETGGLATIFGAVEGGGDALMAAAEEALASAHPGEIVMSRSLAGRPRLLVIDDDLAFASMLAETLSESGWDAYPCSNVEDARQRVLEGDYSGLFIDLNLPGMSGVDLLRRSIAAHPRRPIALMSGGSADPAAIGEALDYGPVLFVRKPISSLDMTSALRMFRDLMPGAVPARKGGS